MALDTKLGDLTDQVLKCCSHADHWVTNLKTVGSCDCIDTAKQKPRQSGAYLHLPVHGQRGADITGDTV